MMGSALWRLAAVAAAAEWPAQSPQTLSSGCPHLACTIKHRKAINGHAETWSGISDQIGLTPEKRGSACIACSSSVMAISPMPVSFLCCHAVHVCSLVLGSCSQSPLFFLALFYCLQRSCRALEC